MDIARTPTSGTDFSSWFLHNPLNYLPVVAILIGLLNFAGCGDRHVSDQPTSSTSRAPASSSPLESSHTTKSGGEKVFGPLKMRVPGGWIEEGPSSSMRKGQFVLPRGEGDSSDGELVVFYFGQGQGGSAEANIDRWISQITQSNGSSSKAKAGTSRKTISGLAVTVVDLSGDYHPLMMPGASSQEPKTGYRMIAAVVETSEGPWFFKLVGPEQTVAKWSASFDQFLNSITVK
jgi:hypothetical protein